ncbi:MAG: methyltransferase domain-containing protein [Fusobacterium sp.]|nr:methyltransferase domain-containing protein [Fusobacterium sp.]
MNFEKHFDKYNNYSYVQKKVANNLTNFIKENIDSEGIESILELGCGTGIFTREYTNKVFSKNNLILNDKFNVEEFIKDINYKDFLQGDIEKINFPKNIDIILSSSVFQWIEDLNSLFQKISEVSNKLCFSTYISGNLIEIKKHFNISLEYKNIEDIEKIAQKYFKEVIFYKETIRLNFETPLDLLKHLKFTGVTGLQKPSISNIRSFNDKILTYEVAYFICKN